MDGVIDEAKEERISQDSYSREDESVAMSSVQQAKSKGQYVLKGKALSKVRISELRNKKTLDDVMFKNDTLRKKYDLRNVDPKTINNIFMRAHIKKLKERCCS